MSYVGIVTFSALVLLCISKNLLVFTIEMIFELKICLVFGKPVPSDLDDDLLTFATEMLFETRHLLSIQRTSAMQLR
jgi:hypothetical protein